MSDDNVVIFNGVTKLDLPAGRILELASKANLKGVVIIGETDEGEFYFASSYADGGDVLWYMAMAHKKLLEMIP